MHVETLAEQMLYSTVRLETYYADPGRVGRATSFIFSVQDNKGTRRFLVTNKHVIQDAVRCRVFFTLRKGEGPDIGNRLNVTIDPFQESWHGHPDSCVDVAVMPINRLLATLRDFGKPVFIKSLSEAQVPNEEQLDELDALEDVVFVGYPFGLYDETNLLPVYRQGCTATPIQSDYNGTPTFLIDASVFHGSSGSPVLIYRRGLYHSRKGTTSGRQVMLLGILAGVFRRAETGLIKMVPAPTTLVPQVTTMQYLDLGVVFKTKTIIETIRNGIEVNSVLKAEATTQSKPIDSPDESGVDDDS